MEVIDSNVRKTSTDDILSCSNPPAIHQSLSQSECRTLSLASLGSALEFYDFIVFVFFSTVIGRLFFPPSENSWLQLAQTYGLFAAGYVVRPIGGFLMARAGDLCGRKRIFGLSVFMMAIPTVLIGILPVYANVGFLAPILLLVMRIAQGAAIGGEAPGAWVFVAEHVPKHRRGLAVSLLTSGLVTGILLGSLVSSQIMARWRPEQVLAGLWRIPFLLGGLLGLIAAFLRRWLAETPVFLQMQARQSASPRSPATSLIRSHQGAVVTSMAAAWMISVTILVVILLAPSLLHGAFGLPLAMVQKANVAGVLALCLSLPLVGIASDRFGVRKTSAVAASLLIASSYLFFTHAAHASLLALVGWYICAGCGAAGAGCAPIAIVSAFPASVRFTGVALSYNIPFAIAGAITPVLLVWLSRFSQHASFYYLATSVMVGVLGIFLAPQADESVSDNSTSAK